MTDCDHSELYNMGMVVGYGVMLRALEVIVMWWNIKGLTGMVGGRGRHRTAKIVVAVVTIDDIICGIRKQI